MKKVFITFICYMFIVPCLYSNDIVKKKLSLEVGGETIIHVANLNGISNAGDIVEDTVLNDGESIMLRGTSWGETQVTAWDKTGNRWIYEIHVAMPKFVKELQSYLQDIEGVSVNFLGRNIIVEGQLLRNNDVPKLTGILNNFPEVKNMVNMTPADKTGTLIEAIKAELFNYNFKFSFLGEGLMFEGRVFSDNDGSDAKAVSQLYFDSVYPAFTINPPKVNLEMNFLEFKLNEGKKAGNNPFFDYVKAVKQKSGQTLSHFAFYEARFHNQSLEKIMQTGTTRPLQKESLDCISGKKITWKDKTSSFTIEIEPKVFNPDWVDLNLSFSIESEGKNLFWQTTRVILRKGQGAAVIGLSELLNQLIPQNQKQLLQNINVLSPFLDNSNTLLLLITPNWTLRE